MRNATRWIGLLALAVAVSLVWLNAQGSKRDGTLFLNLTTDDAWNNEMALNYAAQARDLGYDVVVFLNVRAVHVAQKEPPADLAKAQEQLKSLMARGVKVYVCTPCSRRAGLKPPADWIDGVTEGSRETIEIQMAPNAKVMSY